jgi:hypothetical protein
MSNKTTKAHFELFKQQVAKWVGIYGLKDWEVHLSHEEIVGGSRASASINIADRIAYIGLSPDWTPMKVNDDEIKKSAFHEVTEILTGPLVGCAETRFLNQGEIGEASHYIIRTLENVLFPKY